MKTCTFCKQIKSESEYYIDNASKDKLTCQCKDCMTLYRRKNTDKMRSYMKNRDKDVKRETNRKSWRKRMSENPELILWSNIKSRAKRKNIEFSILPSDIIIPSICPILKVPFVVGTKENYEQSYSVDRINPLGGYTKDNIQVITMKANTMKNNANALQLYRFAQWILSNDDIVRAAQIMLKNESAELQDKEPVS